MKMARGYKHNEMKDMEKALRDVTEIVQNEDRKEVLDVLCLYRNPENGKVCYKLNDRPYGFQDAEHNLCKLYAVVIKTLPSRCHSQKVWASSPHTHPLPSSETIPLPWDDDIVRPIVSAGVDSFHTVTKNELVVLPRVCRYREELEAMDREKEETAAVAEKSNSDKDGEAMVALSDLTVVELKDKLREAGLSVSGRKAELIERLSEGNER
jgi:hypothetical protein